MADKSALQSVVGWLGDFLAWMRDGLNDDQARRAIVGDLGGDVNALPAAPGFPPDGLDGIRRYREAADPDLEALFSALGDARSMFDALRGFATAMTSSSGMALDAQLRAVIDLMATNYLRLRNPRAYAIWQVINFTEDITSVYGDGVNSYGRFVSGLGGVFKFLFGPVPQLREFRLPDETAAGRMSQRVLLPVAVALLVMEIMETLDNSDVLYGWDVVPGTPQVPGDDAERAINAVLSRMLTLQFNRGPVQPDGQRLATLISLCLVPQTHGGSALFAALGNDYQAEARLADPWSFLFEMSGASDAGLMIGGPAFPYFRILQPSEASDFRVSMAIEARPDAPSGHSHVFRLARGTELQLGRLRLEGSITRNAATLQTAIRDSALLLTRDLLDGFLGRLLPPDGLRIPFDLAAGLATDRGAFVEGQVPILGSVGSQTRGASAMNLRAIPPPLPPLPNPEPDAPGLRIRIPIGRSLGPVTVHEFRFELLRDGPPDNPRHSIEVSTSVSAKIGPVVARVDRIGIELSVGTPDDLAQANAGLFDLDLGMRTPDGVGIAVDAKGIVSGGGFLFHDRAQKIYGGALQLTLKDRITLKAFGLLATTLPDGSKGYSLLVFITAEGFRPYPLGMGFTLRGIGGMLGINRRFDEVAMRSGLANGALGKLLFPKDPVRNAPEIIRNLGTLFPAREGTHLIGLLATIAWPTPMLVLMQLALIYEIDRYGRLIVLGRISSLLPSQTNDLVRLNLDAMGLIDFNAGTVAVDANLVDSRIAKKFVLTGGMAMRMQFSGRGAGFAMAVGGFNPRFTAPAGMPKLSRLTIDLSSGDNPRLTCEAYIAVTPNTVQFGARAHLVASAAGFSVVGDVGFDVLVQLLPFHFIADFHASVQLKRGSRNLFKVSVAGELEGPLPLRIAAKATFEILWCDFSVRFDKTLVGGSRPPLPPAMDAFVELSRALGSPESWTAQLSADRAHGVTLRQPAGGVLALDPLGDLTLRQTVVPLDNARALDLFGGAPLAGARSFHIDEVRLGTTLAALDPVRDLFAPAQFFEMDDDEKLSSPSFVEMGSGVRIGSAAVLFDATRVVASPLSYESIVIDDAGGTPVSPPPPYVPPVSAVLLQASFGAVARGSLLSSSVARFTDPSKPPAVTLRSPRLVVAATLDLSPRAPEPGAGPSWIDARQLVSRLNHQARDTAWQLVPAHELDA